MCKHVQVQALPYIQTADPELVRTRIQRSMVDQFGERNGRAIWLRFVKANGEIRDMACVVSQEVEAHKLFIVTELPTLDVRCVKWERVTHVLHDGTLLERKDGVQ
jgi:hypothetical protein